MELEDVCRDGQQRPFRRDFRRASTQKSPVFQILLSQGEAAFCLYRPIDAQQLSFERADLRLHGFSLSGEAFGYLYDLAALLQRFPAPPGAYASLLQLTALAFAAHIH